LTSNRLHKLLEDVDDIAVDVPRVWDYMGEIFTHFFLQLKDNFRKTFFIKCLSPCIAVNKAAKLMVNIVNCASTLKVNFIYPLLKPLFDGV
jgi:hypothetical protein